MPDTTTVEHSRAHGRVRSTDLPGQVIDERRGRIFPCPSCGADLTFHIGRQAMSCGFCGHVETIAVETDEAVEERDLLAALERAEDLHAEGGTDQPGDCEVRCDSCGGTVLFSGTLSSLSCPYCASPLQREDVHEAKKRLGVDGILPLRVPEKTAQGQIGKWVKGRWFAPNRFLREGVDGDIHAVYLPFWTFDALTLNTYRGQRGDHYTVTVGSGKNRRTVVRTRWRPASGRFQRFFDDVVVLAVEGLPKPLLHELEPWPFDELTPFNPQLTAGHYARTYDQGLKAGFSDARVRIEAAVERDVRRRIGGDAQRISHLDTQFDAMTFKHLLLPVWIFAYRYGGKPYRVFVNGATGEVQGERPYSWVKITLTVIAAAVLAAVVALVSQNGQMPVR